MEGVSVVNTRSLSLCLEIRFGEVMFTFIFFQALSLFLALLGDLLSGVVTSKDYTKLGNALNLDSHFCLTKKKGKHRFYRGVVQGWKLKRKMFGWHQ